MTELIGSVSVGVAAAAVTVVGLHLVRTRMRVNRHEATHHALAPEGGTSYDPRPMIDRTRRAIAYLLIGLLATMVIGLPAMVAFGVIPVGGVKDFGVIYAPVVTLVTAATSFYFGANRRD